MSRKQKDAAVAQSVVRRIGSAEVTGPIPVSSSARKERKPLIYKGFCFFLFSTCNSFQLCYNDNSLDGDIAQLGERCVRNAKVAGSNPVVSMIEKGLKTLVFPLFSSLFCVFKISSGTKYSVIGTHVSVQGSHERSHGLSVSMNLPHIFSKRTFEKIQKNKKNSSILNYPML